MPCLVHRVLSVSVSLSPELLSLGETKLGLQELLLHFLLLASSHPLISANTYEDTRWKSLVLRLKYVRGPSLRKVLKNPFDET